MHNKNNPTLIKANFIKTANFLKDLIGSIFNYWQSIKDKEQLAPFFIKRFLIPIIVFIALPFSSVESTEINYYSTVWKNKPAFKGKKTSKITYIYNGKKFDSLSSITNNNLYSDIYSKNIFAKKK